MKVKKLSIILIIFILVAAGTVVAIFIGYRQIFSAPEMLVSSIQDGANLSLGKIRQTATRDGKKEWSLEAGSAHYMENKKKAVLKDLFITYYLENNQKVYLKADNGILNTSTNDIEFSGNVIVNNDDYRMKTKELHYKHKRRLIFSDVPVNISGEAAEISANSLTYELETNKIVLTGDVTTSLSQNFAPVSGLAKP